MSDRFRLSFDTSEAQLQRGIMLGGGHEDRPPAGAIFLWVAWVGCAEANRASAPLFLLHCCGMIGFTIGLWRSQAAEVGWLSLQSGATWQAQPAVVAPPSIGSVVDRFPAGCAWWVVPQSLRSLTSNPFPSPRPMPKISPWLSTMLSTMAPEGDWPSTWEWRQ